MIKKIIIIGLFCLFFLYPASILAQQNTQPTDSNPTIEPSPQVLGIFDNIWNFIVNIFQQITGTYTYIAKEYKVPTIDTRQETNKYDREDKDYSSRAYSENTKKYRKGVWFYEVLTTKKYDDGIINKDDRNCGEISISELVYYFYTKEEKILYKRGEPNNPIDYDPSKLKAHGLKTDDSCYINAYSNIQDVPQGVFNVLTDNPELNSLLKGGGGAAAASTQINENIRTLIPDNYQGETAPDNNDTDAKVRRLIQDTDKQEESMLLNIIPAKNQDLISCNDDTSLNRDNLRDYFECNVNPNKWISNKCSVNGVILDTSNVGCGEKHQINGPGVSQRGAHGLALSGYFYRDIMNLYYGNNIDIGTSDGIDDKVITVVMEDDTDFNKDGISDNDANCQALVGKYALEYNKVDLDKGTGGVRVDAVGDGDDMSPCDKYIKVEKYDGYTGPNYQLTGKCYSTVKLTLHNYLLGIAEVWHDWHLEAWKALTLTHRHTALQSGKVLWNSSKDQVFQCSEVFHNVKTGDEATNQGIAVELTRDEIVIDKATRKRAYVTARSAFCGPGSSNSSFDGFKYEKISYAFEALPGQMKYTNIRGICFEGLSYNITHTFGDDPNNPTTVKGTISDNSIKNNNITRIPSSRSKTVAASLNGNLYYFNDTTRQSPIKENYDLVDVDNGKWLTSFSSQTNCQLDNRVSPALTSLIEKLNQEIPDNKLIPKNCYRNFETQMELWNQGLIKYQDTYTNLIWHSYPGTSTHQTGRVIDFYDQIGRLNQSSTTYQWLLQNASTYGFYHYKLEPWHWEYNP